VQWIVAGQFPFGTPTMVTVPAFWNVAVKVPPVVPVGSWLWTQCHVPPQATVGNDA
jgi:hypothetical protein